MVQKKYVNLFVKPSTNGAYADSGSVSAVFDKGCGWLFNLAKSYFTFFSLTLSWTSYEGGVWKLINW